MILVSSCMCLCPFYWSRMLSGEWRCSCSSADRRCSNYIWLINNLIAHWGASYIKGLMVEVHIITRIHEIPTHRIQTALNTLRPRQNGRHFPDGIFKCIFLNENIWIPLKISLEFVPKVRINNIPALVQITAWHLVGAKPFSEPMLVSLLTHVYVSRPQ